MEKKKFLEVFQNIKLSDELKDIFQFVDIVRITTNSEHTKMRIYIESSLSLIHIWSKTEYISNR